MLNIPLPIIPLPVWPRLKLWPCLGLAQGKIQRPTANGHSPRHGPRYRYPWVRVAGACGLRTACLGGAEGRKSYAYHYHTNAYRKLERKPIRSTRLSMGRRQCSAHQFNSFAVSCPSKAPRSSSYLFGRAQEMWTPSWLQRGLGLLAFVEPCPATVAAAFASLH